METARALWERSFGALVSEAIDARVEGLVVLRCREGLRHGLWVQHGQLVGAHVAGNFDPLLERLRQRGSLSAPLHRVCLAALPQTSARSGAVAAQLAGVADERLRETLQAQLVERAAALLALAHSRGHDAWLEPRAVPEGELSVRMPLGSVLRRIAQLRHNVASDRRKQLRSLAKVLHPDRHAHLDRAAQQQLSAALARATATYHGFS